LPERTATSSKHSLSIPHDIGRLTAEDDHHDLPSGRSWIYGYDARGVRPLGANGDHSPSLKGGEFFRDSPQDDLGLVAFSMFLSFFAFLLWMLQADVRCKHQN
jgi:hypothetical protein